MGVALVVPECVDKLTLVHLRASFYADLFGALLQILLRPVLVAARLPAAFPCTRAAGVGDPRCLLLALALLSQLLVLLVVLDEQTVIFGQVLLPPCLFPVRWSTTSPTKESVTPKGYGGVRLPGLSSPGGGSSRGIGGVVGPPPRLSGLSSPGGGSSLEGDSPPGGEAT